MIYEEKTIVRIKEINKKCKLRNSTILEMLENAGASHANFVGNGLFETEKNKHAWILIDWQIKVIKRPDYAEKLTIKTWIRNITKIGCYRDYEIYNEKNELCIIGTAKWIMLDRNTMKICKFDDEIAKRYQPEDKNVFNIDKIDRIEIPTVFENEVEYKVTRRDIDINNHMHNTYYLDLAYEALPDNIYYNTEFDSFKISCKKEIKLEDKIICKYAKINDKHIVVVSNKENNIIHAVIELK